MAEEHIASELSGLRKEVLEMRNLVIKTDNLLRTFHTELKDVSRKHGDSERRHKLGHVAAYATIGIVALVGSILYGNVAGSSARSEAEERLEEAKQMQVEAERALATAQQRVAAEERGSAEAKAIWQLITAPEPAKQDEGLARLAKLDTSALPTFARAALEQTATSIRQTRAEAAFAAAFVDGRGAEPRVATQAYERFLAVSAGMPASWRTADRIQAAYMLGALYNQLGEHARAVPHLRKYVAEGTSASTKAYAYLLLGDSLEATKQEGEARDAFRKGLALGPSGVTESQLRRRLGEDAPT